MAVVILVFILGLITTNVIGRRLIRWVDAMMCRAPVIQYVYTAARQVVDAVRGLRQVPFKKVVIVEFPKASLVSAGAIVVWGAGSYTHRLNTATISPGRLTS